MIKTRINKEFPHHHITKHPSDVYVADYSNKTKYETTKRATEVFDNQPEDIEPFVIYNANNLEIGNIIFDGNSFKYPNGNQKSQCETCSFPFVGNKDSWILFAELKYGYNENNNSDDFKKAIKQLYKTRYYYLDKNIFDKTNNCYLIISMPKQNEPFPHFILTPNRITDLKTRHNVILKATNSVKILDNKMLDLT